MIFHFSDTRRHFKSAFTLVEMLVAMVIFVIIGVAITPTLKGSGTSQRKASQTKLKAMLIQARTEAVATGNPVGLVFSPISGQPDELRKNAGRSVAIFRLEKNADKAFTATKQISRWKQLDRGVIFGNTLIHERNEVNVFSGVSNLEIVDGMKTNSSTRFVEGAPYIAFSQRGKVLHPAGSHYDHVVIGLWEGRYENGEVIKTRSLPKGEMFFNEIIINRISGRARVR